MCLYHNFVSDHDSVFLSVWHILIHFEKLNIYGVIKINPFGRELYHTLIHDRLFESDIKVYFNSKCYKKRPGKLVRASSRFSENIKRLVFILLAQNRCSDSHKRAKVAYLKAAL